MRKVWLFILIALFINNSFFNQLFRVPFLVSHYIEHHQLNNKIGFMDFLSMHYWGTDLDDDDEEKDMQLPFKKTVEISSFQFIPPLAKINIEKQQFRLSDFVPPVYQGSYHSDPALSSLFRPPRA